MGIVRGCNAEDEVEAQALFVLLLGVLLELILRPEGVGEEDSEGWSVDTGADMVRLTSRWLEKERIKVYVGG